VVTEQNSKALSQAPQKGAAGKPKGGAAQPKADPTPAPAVADAPSADQPKGPVRTVGPPFVASH
jgi:hypothetical protein